MRPEILLILVLPLCAAGQKRLAYATYLGGSGTEEAQAIAADASGNVYLTGYTASADFPVTLGAAQTAFPTATVAFVTKLDAAGARVIYSTYLGGGQAPAHLNTAESRGLGIAVDAAGNAYVTGTTNAQDFPSTFGSVRSSGFTGFVAKLSPAGDKLLYSALLPASPEAIAVDSAGNAYITGSADSGLPITSGAVQRRIAGNDCSDRFGTSRFPCPDAFVAKLNPAGTALVYATYLGGVRNEAAHAITVDRAGNAYIAGETTSGDFPVTPAAIQRNFRGVIQFGPLTYGDAFIAKLNPSGSALVYSSYFGGAQADAGRGITVDPSGNAYLTGWTESADLPTSSSAFRKSYSGGLPVLFGEAFVAKLDAAGGLVYSSYLGGGRGQAIALNSAGDAFVAGNNILPPAAGDPLPACPQDRPYVAIVNPAGTALLQSTPIPGQSLDWVSSIAVDQNGRAHVAGLARSRVFLATPGAFQTRYKGGDSDAFATTIDFSAPIGLQPACLVNAASFEPGHPQAPLGTVAPGEAVAIFGAGLGPNEPATLELTETGLATRTLGGTRVLFDGVGAPLLYAQSKQVNAVVPFEIVGPTTKVVFETPTSSYGPWELPVAPAAPGVFSSAVFNQDFTRNSADNPATRGSVIIIYATGAGQLVPPMPDGSFGPLAPPFSRPALGGSVQIGNQPVPVEFFGAAPTLVAGVIQINARLPESLPLPPGGQLSLAVYAGDYRSQINASVWVR